MFCGGAEAALDRINAQAQAEEIDDTEVERILDEVHKLIARLDAPAPGGLGPPPRDGKNKRAPAVPEDVHLGQDECKLWLKCRDAVELLQDHTDEDAALRLIGALQSERVGPQLDQVEPNRESASITDVLETLGRRQGVSASQQPVNKDFTFSQVC